MALFEPALAITLNFEGGYVDASRDPCGGETYKGISRHFNPEWIGWHLIDKHKMLTNFPLSLDNDQELQDEIKWLYREKYWGRTWGDKILSQEIANKFFDAVVNPGFVSVRFMQRSLNQRRSDSHSAYLMPYALSVDGIMGNNTLDVLNALHADEIPDLLETFKLYRIAYYKEHSKPEFLNGLINRAET